eukprot:TRINITY_DN6836_c0_g1_i3.p1 TRINITY_DN6836_c0_g1~~TRINITY_DN6836_c0_g1_i3.p1  ORF type:complete len:203 (-),score=20.25 TRINITY_DN6836_c0_g1_i3:25-603(-)
MQTDLPISVYEGNVEEQQPPGWRETVSKELREIGSTLTHTVTKLQNQVRNLQQNENSVYNRSKEALDQGVKKGVHVAGVLWDDLADVVQKSSQVAQQTVRDLNAGEKIVAAKQFGGKLISGAEQQLGQLGKKASDIFEIKHQPLEFDGQEITFVLCYHVYGGEQYQEELELLSRWCTFSITGQRVSVFLKLS